MDATIDKYYYIKDVAALTGLSEQVIRKWEARYQVVHPKRLDNGYRVYSPDDLQVLRELKAYRDQGKSMKQAIQSLQHQAQKKPLPFSNAVKQSEYVEELITSGTIYDEENMMFLLKKAHHQYGLELFLKNTVHPFLNQIGDLWETQQWDESQETISSLVVRDFLTQISRNFNNKVGAPHALGFCLPYEQHEIPLQMLLLQMKMRGWRATMIGTSPKFSTIRTLVEKMRPQKVLFSATTIIPFQEDERLLDKLDEIAEAYPQVSFFIGGQGVWEYTKIIKPKHLTISTCVEDIVSDEQENSVAWSSQR